MTGACWSTAICSESERRSLGLASDGEWLLTCRLSDGHSGDHATDASMRPRQDRRAWLMWDDRSVHRVTSRDACPMRSRAGAPCLLFIAHGGMHYYGAPMQHGPRSMPSGEIDATDVRMPTGLADGDRTRSESTRSESASVRVSAPQSVAAARDAEPAAHVVQPANHAVQPATHVAQPVTHAAQPVTPDPEPAAVSSPSVDESEDAVVEALTELAEAVEKLARVLRRRKG